jgi:thymidine kinase
MMSRQSGEHLLWGNRPTGCIEVVCGSMFSGKTEELLRRIKRAQYARQPLQLFKPKVDQRYDAVKVVTHEGLGADATPVASPDELLERIRWNETRVVGIDEVQFFSSDIVDACERIANAGIRVVCAGLDQDYLGKPFGPIQALMAVAEYVTKLHAVCAQCGREASRSQRLIAQEGQLFVGGASAYEARCRACFRPEAL